MVPEALEAAVAYAEHHESAWPREMVTPEGEFIGTAYVQEPPPWNAVLGPVEPRGSPSGLVVRDGRAVAEWGDVERADMTFSVAKSVLAILAGLALADGLIRDLDDPVRAYALDDGFEAPQNRPITWRHLLQQTSEWEGTLWGKPDAVDRNRQVGAGRADNARKGTPRPLRTPGSYFEYNDVRVNRLSLSLLQVFRRPLPEVLRERVMDPIGASDTWAWHAYRNSWVEINGRLMPSVPGGSHWGGGLFVSTADLARLAYLVLRRGCWRDRELVPAAWIDRLATPAPGNPSYGFLWWTNRDRALYPSAPASSLFALGAGSNVVWVDREHDLVLVARWIDKLSVDGLLARVVASLAGGRGGGMTCTPGTTSTSTTA
jgi:CubicO group peptidase (beta-lactamase class C family)